MLKSLIVAGVTIMLAACTVGPTHHEPGADLPAAFGGESQNVEESIPSAEALWSSFDDEQLKQLIDTALKNNTTITQSLAALNATRALSGLQIYSWFPTVSLSSEVERSRQSSGDPFSFGGDEIFEIHRSGFDTAWEIDLFGNLRNRSKRIRREVEADEQTLYAVQLAVVAEVAQTYFQWQGSSRRLALLNDNLRNQSDGVSILEASLEAGRGTSLDVARARSIKQQVAANIPLAESDLARAEQRLAVLTRMPVQTLRSVYQAHGNLPVMPAMVAAGSPTEWLLRRPDVRAAERRLAAATAGVGVEMAQFYPQLNLAGSFGWTDGEAGSIGDSDAERWRGVPTLSWRILDFGRVRQRVVSAKAQAAGALAAYDEAWLLAIEETENALTTYNAMTQRVGALELAVAAMTTAAELSQLRYDAGSDDYLSVLDADRGLIDVGDQLVQAQTDRATALAALYKAFGGDFTARQ